MFLALSDFLGMCVIGYHLCISNVASDSNIIRDIHTELFKCSNCFGQEPAINRRCQLLTAGATNTYPKELERSNYIPGTSLLESVWFAMTKSPVTDFLAMDFFKVHVVLALL